MSKESAYFLLKNCPFAVTLEGRKITEKEVAPYQSIADVLELLKLFLSDTLPCWIKTTNSLAESTAICCAVSSENNADSRSFYVRSNKPKTLVCHDFMGNYHDFDSQIPPCTNNKITYDFSHWMGIDIFIYFSHSFITIPPPYWINQAHRHGVAILGTLITEGKEGKELCDEIFQSEERWKWFAEALSAVAIIHKFDGYLINIENSLSTKQVLMMVDFLAYLKKLMLKPSYLIWYDAVTIDGKLSWQDALNEHNEIFFNVCDGIFLNYNFDSDKLKKTIETAGKRNHDVYVGVDVFGRSKPPACFSTADSFALLRLLDLSVALFAPGWTIEASPGGSPLFNDFIFWTSLRPYLYFHGVKRLGKFEGDKRLCWSTLPPANLGAFNKALDKMRSLDKLEDKDAQKEVANEVYSTLHPPVATPHPELPHIFVFSNKSCCFELQLYVLELVINQPVTVKFDCDFATDGPSFFVTLLDRNKQLTKIRLEAGETKLTDLGTLVEFAVSSSNVPQFHLGSISVALSEDSENLDISVYSSAEKSKLDG